MVKIASIGESWPPPPDPPEHKQKLTLKSLRDDCDMLMRLLDDPQPGLITWWEFLGKRIDRIVEYQKQKPAVR